MYDAIILGGGPAGLAMASELSRKHSVLLIEKNKIGTTQKAWTTSRKIVEEAGVQKHISVEFPLAYLRCLDGEKFYLHGDFVSMDECGVLDFWKKRALKNGARIEDETEFKSMKRKNGAAHVKTSKGSFTGRLLIDCMGANSPLARELFERVFYWSVYGEVFTNVDLKDTEIVGAAIRSEDVPTTWFEVLPVSKTSYVAYVFQYIEEPLDPEKLSKIHQEHMREFYPKSNPRFAKRERVREVKGIIPMGITYQNSKDNLFLFGDTSGIAPALAGSGFTNILRHHKKVAQHLSEKMVKGKLSEADLEYIYNDEERFSRDLQIIVGLFFLHSTPEQLKEVFSWMQALPNRTFFNLTFQKMRLSDCVELAQMLVLHADIQKIARILPEKEYFFMAQVLSDLVGDTVLFEAGQAFDRLYDILD